MKKYSILILSLLFLATISVADEYAVISHKKIKHLSTSQIKAIFLKKITVIDGVKIVPMNLSAGDKLRLKFEKKILKMSFARLKTYWTKQHYLGHRPPISMKSQESVKAFVKKVDGAIGYINVNNLDNNMNIVYEWSD